MAVRFQQPQAGPARLDRANPLVRGLVALLNPGTNQDVMSGLALIGSGSISINAALGGLGSSAAAENTFATIYGSATGISTGDLTEFVLLVWSGGTANYIYCSGTYAGSVGAGLTTKHASIAGNWGCLDSGVSGSFASAGEVLPNGTQFLVHTRDGTTHRLYRNGVQIASVAGTNGDANATTAFSQNNLGSGAIQASMPAPVLLSGRYSRALSPSEVARLSANPWQLFSAPRSVLKSSAVAGTHTSTGALTGSAATIAGTATHAGNHAATGALAASSATIAGTAARTAVHASSGALTGQAAMIAGAAVHSAAGTHIASGALAAGAATIAGAATHFGNHPANGVLTGQPATIAGTAARVVATVTHASSGALVAGAATISGGNRNKAAAPDYKIPRKPKIVTTPRPISRKEVNQSFDEIASMFGQGFEGRLLAVPPKPAAMPVPKLIAKPRPSLFTQQMRAKYGVAKPEPEIQAPVAQPLNIQQLRAKWLTKG